MAKILVIDTGNEGEIPAGEPVKDVCDELGVLFGCRQGMCGTCKVVVEEGMDNLAEKNERELEMDLEPNQRLMCQAILKDGDIKIKQY